MIVVSGCPRSGTSLMMESLRRALGEDRILGIRFPFSDRAAKLSERREDEENGEYAVRKYLMEKYQKSSEARETAKKLGGRAGNARSQGVDVPIVRMSNTSITRI